tara:strand:- start:2526 stop:2696 length:171 start_codon:yes stop_codon:yes gene_type:complete
MFYRIGKLSKLKPEDIVGDRLPSFVSKSSNDEALLEAAIEYLTAYESSYGQLLDNS